MRIKGLSEEAHEMWDSLLKENRALDMELMEAWEKIRSLENTLAFLKLTKFENQKMDKI